MTDWNKLKVVDLKAELKKRGLAQTGLKPALVARLIESESQSQDGSESEATIQDDAKNDAKNDASSVASPDTVSSVLPPSGLSNEVVVDNAPAATETRNDTPAGPADSANIEDSVPQTTPIEGGKILEEFIPQSATVPDSVRIPRQPSQANNDGSALSSVEPQEAAEDSLKRKQRSQSPPPLAADVARKRFKAAPPKEGVATAHRDADWIEKHNTTDAGAANAEAKEVEQVDNVLPEPTVVDTSKDEVMIDPVPLNDAYVEPTGQEQAVDSAEQPLDTPTKTRDSRFTGLFTQSSKNPQRFDSPDDLLEADRDVEPAIHPATSALYIRNLMRPLQSHLIQSHLAMLATAPGADTDPDVIVNFYLDPIKTHAFVVFRTTSAASRVRNAFHDRIWPDEKNRKPLWVDFVPLEKAEEWIAEEMATNTGPRSQRKWEVDYRIDEDRHVTAVLQEVNVSRPIHPVRQPAGPASSQQISRNFDPPSGPRGFNQAPKPAVKVANLGELFESTKTKPVLYYKPVSKELANKRLGRIDSALSKDAAGGRHVTGDINRYTFEDGDRLVDRGPEIFSGIRPPPGYRGGRGGRGSAPFRDRGRRDFDGRGGRRDESFRENRYDSYRGDGSGPRSDRRY